MSRVLKDGLVGLGVGVLGGAAAALLFGSGRRHTGDEAPAAGAISVAEPVLHAGRALFEGSQALLGREGNAGSSGILPDEQVTMRVQAELERLGISSPHVDVNTVDGTVYLRGREADSARADTLTAIVRDVPGVSNVVDEVRRE